ncbi:hypothetical protein MCOR02_006316 [Pyricularia oryzae]|uniref:ABC transporter domain-containing protein n=3 Tax=Pyricularia TaxID=48558 RepID=A0ABQ8NTC0_PYRGI|nr:hypothetical protein MCOR01_007116 [Pyricularia oryzae]KAI6301852.1 hypothetical protein MCOR33_002691 [Pyricularia grisea]KAH9434299.1 hypothetical protein MCOR02_006316 [Pyricularia oryzae]KAI6260346.1 hypothetical protein MCOR19_003363 [Pyricularia oryzae]KAI6280782.1 hypothetical protein MCOR26_003545 [Pyricularia oryzae]
MAFIRQTITLVKKNFLIILWRHSTATVLRAFLLPIFLAAFLSFARFFFVPPARNGVADSLAIRSLGDSLRVAGETSRNTVVFVDGGHKTGDIDRVINNLTSQVEDAGKTVFRLDRENEIQRVCKSSLRGVSQCYGAAVFNGSPDFGGIWNYTLRMDGGLGPLGRIDVESNTRDAQIFVLPFQRAVDAAITGLNSSSNSSPLSNSHEYVFTSLTQSERDEEIRVRYQQAVTNFMGVAFILAIIGVCYHLTGFMATEREIGMSTLIESMMPTRQRWQAQAARLLSYHIAFDVIYLPGWIIGALILQLGVFRHTSTAMYVFYNITAGLALSSMSIFGAAFFKKAQLSGVVVTIVYCVLAIVAQAISYPSTAQVTILSLLFAPCNYVYFIANTARWEAKKWPTDLTDVPPNSAWDIPAIWLWVFLIIQIIVYPIVGALIERYLYGTATKGRNIVNGGEMGGEAAVRLEGFTKIYKPGFIRRMFSFISKPKPAVRAVDGLTLSAGRGQILALLGANGSGKSTSLDAIAGINRLTSGSITIDGTGGLGIAPQKNVLWDDVTVEEHIRIFNSLKAPANKSSKEEIRQLVEAVDLTKKIKARSKTLSGGQKRKLQLGMMLTGGSAVCCVDEVSSGLDPLSRRKIWDILLAERGKRTMILTTHFLDEADLLADHIAVLSKGTLRAEGSSVELKNRLGGGYRIHFLKTKTLQDGPVVEGVTKKVSFDIISYIAPSSALAAEVIRTLEAHDIRDYRFSGPTIEDVFLQLAEEVKGETDAASRGSHLASASLQGANAEKTYSSEMVTPDADKDNLELMSGNKVGIPRQALVLFRKRCTVFKHNWFPSFAAFIIPILAAGLCTLFIRGQSPAGCSTQETRSGQDIFSNDDNDGNSLLLLYGPTSPTITAALNRTIALIRNGPGDSTGSSAGSPNGGQSSSLFNIESATSFADFNRGIIDNRKNVTPAGFWLGDTNNPPTLAYTSVPEMQNAFFGQNLMNMLLTNTTLSAKYAAFDTPWQDNTGNSLQLLVYICLALSAYPAFFALYPNVERRRFVRGLQYSNGVRQFPLWIAYVLFDFINVVISSAIVIGLFVAIADVWYHAGYLFLILVLYGLCAILLSYNISIFASNQLSAYAFAAGFNAVTFLVYLIGYMATITFARVDRVDSSLLVVNFVVSAFAPIGSAVRGFFIALNLFSTTCQDQELAPNPGGFLQYGSPIMYLIIQAILLFLLLLWLDSGTIRATWQRLFGRKNKNANQQAADISDEEVAGELVRVTSSATDPSRRRQDTKGADGVSSSDKDGLQVVHVTKTFGKNTAVDNVTFGVKHGEVFALLGPNGAGKSTSLNMIRGDLQPSPGGDVFVEGVSVSKQLAAARANLGVCPQYDAIDVMTVTEHLRFYARVRGIADVDRQVEAVIRAVGLELFRDRQAFALSGGNKRKLSLGIALMGNPSVILLDEPSSGLDAAAKRIMWRTLAGTVPGRSILLTTHSMEEADALAGRVGILAKRMLAMGSADNLRHRFGDLLHVHIVLKGAPRTSDADAERVRNWIVQTLPGAEVEEKVYHGQLRFSVPASVVSGQKQRTTEGGEGDEITREGQAAASSRSSQSAVGKLVVMLEENKHLGIEHYAVSPTTLDQVFLTIVGKHNVKEEGYNEDEKPTGWKRLFSRRK